MTKIYLYYFILSKLAFEKTKTNHSPMHMQLMSQQIHAFFECLKKNEIK